MDNLLPSLQTEIQRRKFLEWIGLSSLAVAFPMISLAGGNTKSGESVASLEFKNVFEL